MAETVTNESIVVTAIDAESVPWARSYCAANKNGFAPTGNAANNTAVANQTGGSGHT